LVDLVLELFCDHGIADTGLHAGTRAYNFEDRLHVMPIDRIWTPI
jgi:hypothetical protein